MAARRLSELEHVVLGIVWKWGPLTPHAVRAHFTASRSARFSASAGAIYPLMTRLERARLLASRRDRARIQRRRLYTITPRGLRSLRSWLTAPPGPADAAALHDPIRARVYFLGAVPPAARSRFLAQVRAGLARTLELLNQDLAVARAASTLSALALAGAAEVTRAQIRWLSAIRSQVTRVDLPAGRPRRSRVPSAPRRSTGRARHA